MTNSRQREEALFEAVLEVPAAERSAFLARECGDDAALCRRVEALLVGHQTEGVLDASPALSLRDQLPLAEKPGDKIGRYKLLQHIGEGGCGVVYMAEQEEPVRRRVALKVIKLGMDTRRVIARFEAERQALALMDHPNITRVLDAGATDAGRPFFVMELVRGVKFTEYCDTNNLSTEERLRLFTQVCHALQHAHQKGIIHRDIKPSNILVTMQDGLPVPKVIDFGIAKATGGQQLTDKTLFTAFEQFVGTPAYMSPEQAELSTEDVDTRSDIYSLGVLLYELLTGKTPFDAKELTRAGLDALRRTIREVEPPRPSAKLTAMSADELLTTAERRRTDVPQLIVHLRGDLDWIVMKCLEKNRARRYETAYGLALDVERYLANEPVTARPPSTAYRLQKLVQRNRLAFAAATALAVTLLVALAFLLWSNARTIRERNQKDIALHEKALALDAARASEQLAKAELFTSLQSQARARRYSRQMGQRLESLAAVMAAARVRVDAGLRDEAIAALALPDVRPGPSWPVARTNCVALACDAMGQRYAILDQQGALTVRSIDDNRQIQRFEIGPTCADCFTSLTFSPDGKFLVKEGDEQPTLVWSLATGELVLRDAAGDGGSPTFSHDGRLMALGSWQDVVCFDLVLGREINRWKTSGHVHSLQFNPTDNRLAVGYKEGPWASVYDATNGQELAQLDVGVGWRMVVSWHPEGGSLAIGSTAMGIQIWNVATRCRVTRLESQAHELDFLTFHPSGKWLASWTWDGVMNLWEPTTGRQAMQIPLVAQLQFSRDGRWLGYFWPDENRAQLLELVSPEDYFTLPDNAEAGRKSYNACVMSPDGKLLAVAMNAGLDLWDFPQSRKLARLPSGHNETVVFEADGQALWTCSTNNGLQRWMMNPSGTNRLELRVEPPQRIALPFAPMRLAADRNARTLAIVSRDSGQAVVLEMTNQVLRGFVVEHPLADFVALSPDARWLATSGWHSDRCRLWSAQTGQLLKEWVLGTETKVAFTPDNRELIISRSSDFHFLNLATLETSRRFKREIGLYPGDVAFSPDGKLMAMEMSPAVIHLKEVATGQTVAQLEDPFGDRASTISFSSEGTKLIVLSSYASAIHVWDLRAVRSRLQTMGLDCDWPELGR